MNVRFPGLIERSITSFNLDLGRTTVVTEAATGNYVVTPVIAARAGAAVIAVRRDSRYGSATEVERQTIELARVLRVEDHITFVSSLDEVSLAEADIVTNTGFVRPITEDVVRRLSPGCVIPLMWETWEFRSADLDLDACLARGIKVYGTCEDDPRLRTKDYIGWIVIERLLAAQRTAFSTRVLLVGGDEFSVPAAELLVRAGYDCESRPAAAPIDARSFDAIVLLEHHNPVALVGDEDSLIPAASLRPDQFVIHICGTVDFSNLQCPRTPDSPAPFGYMSYTTDRADPKAVIDLHTAGLKVGEGMREANRRGLSGVEYKDFMEREYPAQAFADARYW